MSRSSGIGVYLRHVVQGLVSDAAQRFVVTTIGGETVPGARHVECRSAVYSIGEVMEIPLRVPATTDVLWSPNYNAPLLSPGRLVVTIHDACHLALPQFFGSALKHQAARAMFSNVRRRARQVVCDSEFTRDEVNRLAGIDPGRVTVVYPGIRPVEATTMPRPVAAPYLLFVGNMKPHKNLGRLVEAFSRLKDRIPHSLVLVGKREGFITPDRHIGAATEQLGDRVVFTDEVPDDVLASYYRHADLLVFPSLYEGFGMPPLEAMSAGVPVAASRVASIPEICGDSAVYFDPHVVDDMTSAIARALSDRSLRAELRRRGYERVRRFSWGRTVNELASIFESVAA